MKDAMGKKRWVSTIQFISTFLSIYSRHTNKIVTKEIAWYSYLPKSAYSELVRAFFQLRNSSLIFCFHLSTHFHQRQAPRKNTLRRFLWIITIQFYRLLLIFAYVIEIYGGLVCRLHRSALAKLDFIKRNFIRAPLYISCGYYIARFGKLKDL